MNGYVMHKGLPNSNGPSNGVIAVGDREDSAEEFFHVGYFGQMFLALEGDAKDAQTEEVAPEG